MTTDRRPRVTEIFRDLESARWIFVKGFLFLFTSLFAAGLLLAEHPSWRVLVLLTVAVWCFARFYYFAFYVIQHYVDPGYRFDGLISFARYCFTRTHKRLDPAQDAHEAQRVNEAGDPPL